METVIEKKESGHESASGKVASQQKVSAFLLQDNRPQTILQKKLVEGLTNKHNASAPVQRVISFKIGKQNKFADIDQLKDALKQLYLPEHYDEIDELVDGTEAQTGRAHGAVSVYNSINKIAEKKNWKSPAQPVPADGHGPSLPTATSKKAVENKQDVMSAFMFPTVTVAKAQLILENNTVVPFNERNSDAEHAEELLVKDINTYLAENKIDPKTCRLRITINNAPCGYKEKDCAGMLTNYAAEKKFRSFSVYFMNPYGSTMSESVSGMQKEGIRVASFIPKQTRPPMVPEDYSAKTWAKIDSRTRYNPKDIKLDPWSDDESAVKTKKPGTVERKNESSESESDQETDKVKKGKKLKKETKKSAKQRRKEIERRKKTERSDSSEDESGSELEELPKAGRKKQAFRPKKSAEKPPPKKKRRLTYKDDSSDDDMNEENADSENADSEYAESEESSEGY